METSAKVPSDPFIVAHWVKQYLEENVDQTYVDVAVIAGQIRQRYAKYKITQNKAFYQLVEKAYRIVVRSYGLHTDVSSEYDEADTEMVEDDDSSNKTTNLMNKKVKKIYESKITNIETERPEENGPITISSDENETEHNTNATQKLTASIPRILDSATIKPLNLTNKHPQLKQPPEQPNQQLQTQLQNQSNVQATQKQFLQHRQPRNPKSCGNFIKCLDSISKKRPFSNDQMRPVNNNNKFGRKNNDKDGNYSRLERSQVMGSKQPITVVTSKLYLTNIAGIDEKLIKLCEILFNIKHSHIYKHIGLKPPKGILIHGPPGCGKSMLAMGIAGTLNYPIICYNATEFIAGVSGESEQRIRNIFHQAIEVGVCLILIDNIDVIGTNQSFAEKEMSCRIVSQLISSLDNLNSIEDGENIVVVGITRKPETLDPGLIGDGRLDFEISLGIPDRKQRAAILRVICENIPIEPNFHYDKIAKLTPGYVGGDLKSLVKKACSIVFRRAYIEEILALQADDNENILTIDLDGKDELTEEITEKNQVNLNPADSDVNVNVTDIQELISQKPRPDVGSITDQEMIESTPINRGNESNDNRNSANELQIDEKSSSKILEREATAVVEVDLLTLSVSNHKDISSEVSNSSFKPNKKTFSNSNTTKPKVCLLEMINLLSDECSLTPSTLDNICVTMDDFEEALKNTKPAALREGFLTVPDVTWNDIGSLENIREELQLTIFTQVKYPEKLQALGITMPAGVLLFGPPGCGKTLLAKAIANEAGINFISVKGPELLNMYVGESERAVRTCFQRARNSAPCVLFFDEFDALCPRRSKSSENYQSRIVNQLLTEMDGVESRKGIYLLAATNRPDILDAAVLRPGRLETILYVGLPNDIDREQILSALSKNRTKPAFDDDVKFPEISSLTDGFTGADLAGLLRQASYLALNYAIKNPEISDNGLKVRRRDFLDALKLIRPSVTPEDCLMYVKLRDQYAAPRNLQI